MISGNLFSEILFGGGSERKLNFSHEEMHLLLLGIMIPTNPKTRPMTMKLKGFLESQKKEGISTILESVRVDV